ncbi:MAG: 4-hydroxyphenylacetate decarboxylase small subunit [Elusimicrobiaceae bacterium]
MEKTHRACRNFAPVDTTCGICVLTGERFGADESACRKMTPLPRCASCANFSGEQSVCQASKTGFMAFADMSALNCPDYSAKK